MNVKYSDRQMIFASQLTYLNFSINDRRLWSNRRI